MNGIDADHQIVYKRTVMGERDDFVRMDEIRSPLCTASGRTWFWIEAMGAKA